MVLVEKPEGGNHLEDPDIDGRIIRKWIFEGVGLRDGGEPSCSIKCGEFLE